MWIELAEVAAEDEKYLHEEALRYTASAGGTVYYKPLPPLPDGDEGTSTGPLPKGLSLQTNAAKETRQ